MVDRIVVYKIYKVIIKSRYTVFGKGGPRTSLTMADEQYISELMMIKEEIQTL